MKVVEQIKWRYRLKSRRQAPTLKGAAGSILTVIVGVSLAGLGGYLVYRGYAGASFTSLLLGAIFAVYGCYAVAHVLRLVGK
jgi:hypothetical protein